VRKTDHISGSDYFIVLYSQKLSPGREKEQQTKASFAGIRQHYCYFLQWRGSAERLNVKVNKTYKRGICFLLDTLGPRKRYGQN